MMIKDRGIEEPKFQVLFYPPLDLDFFSESISEFSDGFFLTGDQTDLFAEMYMRNKDNALNSYLSPILHSDLSRLPEAVIITVEHDPLRDDGETYVAKLGSAGVQVTGIRAMRMIHGLLNFTLVLPVATGVADMVCPLSERNWVPALMSDPSPLSGLKREFVTNLMTGIYNSEFKKLKGTQKF
ncbi:MAG: alpha/beta hydrolase [Thermoplasmatales archaeon]|nr:alpha/beta hydrolase [Thermoplasmatales archaeon]MCW6170324.1 alpha/beta hydrolase [Thermoplasmatales archaeon]